MEASPEFGVPVGSISSRCASRKALGRCRTPRGTKAGQLALQVDRLIHLSSPLLTKPNGAATCIRRLVRLIHAHAVAIPGEGLGHVQAGPPGRIDADARAFPAAHLRAPQSRDLLHRPDPQRERVRDYLHAHYCENVTVQDLAPVAGLSRVHLTRAFTQRFGAPPHLYLNAVRLRQAQAAMLAGTPLAEVAAACGFADQSHFTRRFKGSVGTPPAQWLRQMRA